MQREQHPPARAGGPDARALATASALSECDRLVAATLLGFSPAALSSSLYGLDVAEEQSTFALLAGIQFEQRLTSEDCELLRECLRDRRVLDDAESGPEDVVNVDHLVRGTDANALREREALTRRLLRQKLRGDPHAPTVIYHPRLTLVVAGVVRAYEPDFLVASRRDPIYRAGEAKSFRDRGTALTNPSALRMARFQGAVEVLALKDSLRRLGPEGAAHAALVPPSLELVLRPRSGARPSLRTQAIPHEVEAVARLIDRAPERVAAVLGALPTGESLGTRAGLESVPNHFTPACRGQCGLAAACEQQGWARGEFAVLGPAVERTLGVIGSIPRLLALLEGAAEPVSAEEQRAVRTFARAYQRLEQHGVVHGTDAVGRALHATAGARWLDRNEAPGQGFEGGQRRAG